jgi:hypothetical protein
MEKSLVRQYIVDEKGNPTAVILSIENFRKILSILDDVENYKENIRSFPVAGICQTDAKRFGGCQIKPGFSVEGRLG